jgi:hypothetical protein
MYKEKNFVNFKNFFFNVSVELRLNRQGMFENIVFQIKIVYLLILISVY